MGSLADCLKKMRGVFPESDRLELMAAARKSSERDAVQTALTEAQSDLQEIEAAIRSELGMASPRTAAADEWKPTAGSIDTVDKYHGFRKRLLDGEVTLDEYKQAFQQTKDNKDALLAGLKKLNKDQLVKISNSFHARKSESKDRLVAQAYDGMLRGFALGRGVSYAMTGKGSYENAMAKLVEQTTADDLAKFAEEVSKNTAEYKARVQGFLDPKTLEGFNARVRIKGEASLTPEQLARYDELLAQAGREKREQAKEQKATVQGVDAGTDLQLIESKHTKTGEALWVVKLASRVDRSVYDRLNQAAHKLGGRYSSYNKDGAIPGFTFRSKEAADSFVAAGKGETFAASPIREAAKAAVQDSTVTRLRDMADRLSEKSDEILNADRKTNTARRARMASSADDAAYKNKALADTMRNLADAIESGEATHLSGLRTKAQVEMLDSMIEQAKYERVRKETKGSYVDYERQKHRKAEPADAAHATFPVFNFHKNDLHSAMNALKAKPATERLRMRLTKQLAGAAEDAKRAVPREDAELALSKLTYTKHPGAPFWQWREVSEKLTRLESMGITSLPELRAALREYVEYRGQRGTIDKAKQLERNLIGNKGIGNDFFPTPKATAERMVREADIQPGMKVLEPSAGNGNIAEAIKAAGVNPDVVESSSSLREILEAKGFNLVGRDFMDVTEGGYDRIIMNPPFSNGQDAEHIQHAYELLKPGGKLVAIAGEGIFFRNDVKSTAFRSWLEEQGGTEEKLPEGTFKDSSLMATTGVNARLVVVEKPETDQGVALYDERGSGRSAPSAEQFAQAFNEGVPIPGTDQQIVDTSQEYPKELLKQLSTRKYVRQLTTELNKVFNSMKRVLAGSDPAFRNSSFAALSPDSYYYGVNDRGPDRIALNPWAAMDAVHKELQNGAITEAEVPEYLAGFLIDVMVHEFTHQQVITTHKDAQREAFDQAEDRNHAILGARLMMLHRQLVAVLTGGDNGAVEGIRADLRQQQAFWKKGDEISPSDSRVPSEPTYARRRQSESGEGASGRTGPPEDLRDGGEVSSRSLDESPGLRGRSAVTETPAFKSWFKNSKVVDANGKPLVVYHGTRSNFDVFDIEKTGQASDEGWFGKGIYLTPDPREASNYAEGYPAKTGGSVMPLYVSAKNPFETDLQSLSQEYVDKVIARGHDAIFRVDYPGDTIPKEIVVFSPEQIKSATANRGTFDPKDSRIQFSKREEETGTIDPPTAKARLNAAKPALRPYLLGALGLEQIAQVYGKDHAEVKQYNKATQAMEADFVEMSRSSEQIVKSWTALKIPVADQMAKVMEEARFLNFDPDPTKKQEADSQKKKDVRKRFNELPAEAQATYRLARDFYTTMAETRFQALKERIQRAGGTPENTRKLVDRLQIAYEQVRSKVYFPFTRFGENIVVAKQMKDGKEVDREVHAFESKAEAQQFATLMKMKGWTVKQTVAKEYSLDKEGPASKIVRQMHDIIKELDEQPSLPGAASLTEQLLDSLNQSFLQALPDMSYAKHFIHAKDVKGASKDALRAFAHSALHGAHHISRIKHADKVTNALMKLDERINETSEGDVTEARQVYNELVQRHNEIMNPSTHPVAAWLGQLGFTMSLGGVVATGITNATQVPLVTYPWLGARYGFGKASAALARAYKDFLDPRTVNKDSLFDATKSKLISESERKMLLELARRGHIDFTQTMDLAGLSAQDNLSRRARLTGTLSEKVSKMLGFTFHVPEVMNRQVTALATYRLERAKEGATFDGALERAQQAVIDTQFLYQAWNRPRYMSGNFLRVLTMFKQYSQWITYTYGRAASIWMDRNMEKNAKTAEEREQAIQERKVAKRQLVSMLALQFGAAGALGVPFFGSAADILMAVVNAFGDDDDKRDWEVALRKWLDGSATSLAEAFIDDKDKAREVGREIAEVVSHGASRLTPWDMASRLGQGDLFFREPQREREGRSAVMDWVMALGGPVPSYGVNFLLGMGDVAKGVTDLNAGFFLRGVEELTPAVLRNGVKSLRYVLEDVRTRDQYKQLELDKKETLGQMFGFTPSRVAEMYESTTAVKNKEHRVLNQRKALLERFSRAVNDQSDDAKERTIDAIRGFNEREPMFAITSDTLNRSLKTRRQHEMGMERGMYLPPRRRALLDEADFADF